MHPVSGSNRAAKPARSLWIRIAIATLCLPVHACDLGSGGAVELSWSLRPASGSMTDKIFFNCEDPHHNPPLWQVTRIRLHWQVGGATSSHAWHCNDHHGATGFEIPPDPQVNLWLTPECGREQAASPTVDDHPAAPDTYIAPGIVQREVIRGETVTLGAVELVVSVECPGPSCICPTGAQVAPDHTSH